MLTDTVLSHVTAAVFDSGDELSDPVARWDGTLLRATVFGWCNASVADAFLLVWAAEHEWFGAAGDTVHAQQLDAVRAAATAVVEAHLDFVPEGDAETESGRTAADDDATHLPAAGDDSVEPVPETARKAEAVGPDDPEEVCRALALAVERASRSMTSVQEAVDDGRPPVEQHVRHLAELPGAFRDARLALDDAGIEPGPLRLDDMRRAAESFTTQRRQDSAVGETLLELLSIGCRPGSPAAAAAETVRTHAQRLLDVPVWDGKRREEGSALVAMAELVRLGQHADADPRTIVALQTQVVRSLPSCAAASAMAHDLTLGEQTGPAEGSEIGSPSVETPKPAEEPTRPGLLGSDEEAVDPPAPDDGTDTAGTDAKAEQPPDGTGQTPVEDNLRAAVLPGAEPAPRVAAQSSSGEAGDGVRLSPAGTRPVDVAAAQGAVKPTAPSPGTKTGTANTAGHGNAPSVAPGPAAVSSSADGSAEPEGPTRTEHALARLIKERRFGLANHVAKAADYPEPLATALRLAGAAALITSATSPSVRLVEELLRNQSGLTDHDPEGTDLLLVPALLRVALITGDHMAGAQLKTLAPRLPHVLGEVTTQVADRALSGALMLASPLTVIADASGTDARLREIHEQCRRYIDSPPRLRFARATEIGKRWLRPDDGLLGSMLTRVINDDRDMLRSVREKAERLMKLPEVNTEIDRIDRKYRSSSRKALQGAGRQDLVRVVEDVVALAKEWCIAVEDARKSGRSDTDRVAKEVSSLRHSLLARKDAVLADLARLSPRPEATSTAAAHAAIDSLSELFSLLEGKAGQARIASPSDAGIVLDAELLKVCNTVAERPALDHLLAAVGRPWHEALQERLDHDAFHAARTIVELARNGDLPASDGVSFGPQKVTEIEALKTRRRQELDANRKQLLAEVRQAQADGAVTDDQDLRMQELLEGARTGLENPEGHDLSEVRATLQRVRTSLPAYREEAAGRIRARLGRLEVASAEREQVLRHLDTGKLPTAADLVYFMEIGESMPEIDNGETHLGKFFPEVPEKLPRGIDGEFISLVRSGGRHPEASVLDYRHLSGDEAELAATALDNWWEVGALEPKDRPNFTNAKLLPALKLLGYDTTKGLRRLDELSHQRREHRFLEATDVQVNGRATVPDFGSKIREQDGRLRLLLVWGRPPAEMVMSLASRDPSGSGLLVLYFGTLNKQNRVELAVGSRGLRPLLVVDDAALAYLAARGSRQVSSATQTLLPFSGVNPYILEKRGRIGGEMFYGRDAERKSILDPQGTQVIFGGRGLGKSALLSDAGDRFTEQYPGFRQTVYVNLDQVNIGKGSALGPETVWSVLERELTAVDVLPGGRGRKAPHGDRWEYVRKELRRWLDEEPMRRLLILLDECDLFFEADAPRFDQTKKLKGLGSETKDRVKVVFAGLHSVQRFSKLASNGPFGHLAQTPTVIGPLAPQFAADLLVHPMRALGFEFADVDVTNRVLGYCSYQPFLLQMFGHRLVQVMQRKRQRRPADGPPYTIEEADVEAVESDTDLRGGISAAFKDTLSLDHRYDVIANVLAHHARHFGLEGRLSDAELRDECQFYWSEGFEKLDTEGFRAYLSEMVGLGVLAPNHDGQGWHLRGPNALRMIGTSHEVEARLERAHQDYRLGESIVLEGRPELPDKRPAPLTITQLDDLLGDRANRTRVVLGTPATGVTEVSQTLRTVTSRISGWKLPPVGRPGVFRQELIGGRPGERRVVISDFTPYPDTVKQETLREAVDMASTALPVTPGVTRSAVIVTDTRHLDLWRSLLLGSEETGALPVVLRRHDRRSLQDWAQRTELFATNGRLDRLYELTGGWPCLVERAYSLHRELNGAENALQKMAELTTDRSDARNFAQATGVMANPKLLTGYRAVVKAFGEGSVDVDDIIVAIALELGDEEDADWVYACLDALQVFEREGASLKLEPLLHRCVSLCT
ncbi:AAA family ATPase [Streptomyces aculeolatus]